MPIAESDLKEYKSLNADSDGGVIDNTREITPGVDNNLWPDITAAEASAGGTKYRKTFRKNTHASIAWQSVVSWIKQQPSGATVSVGIGIDNAADNASAQGNMTAFTATAAVALVSDGADTRTATIVGEDGSGVRQVVNKTLNGTTEVVTTETWSKVYAVYLSATDAARTVTVRQGAGGPTRGTIGPSKIICWIWRSNDLATQGTGYKHGNIASGGSYFGLWFKLTWPSSTAAVSATSEIVRSEGETVA